jgi:hypothetical protein
VPGRQQWGDTVEKLDQRAFRGLIGYFSATSMSLSY